MSAVTSAPRQSSASLPQDGVRPMRVALVYTPLTNTGGGERQMLEEMRWLRRLGHEAAAFTFAAGEDGLFIEGIAREDIRVLPARRRLEQMRLLRKALRSGFDLLLAHTSPELAWLATLGGELPMVLYHNDPPFSPEANPYWASRRYRRVLAALRGSVAGYADVGLPRGMSIASAKAEVRTLLMQLALRRAGALVVPSERTREELARLYGVDATVVRGCLDPAILESRPAPPRPRLIGQDQNVILTVSRLASVKRVDLVIRALAHVRVTVPDAVLVVVGRGPERARLSALTRSLGLEDVVRFAGFLSDAELWRHYAHARAFACPAHADFCITPYEALALGCTAALTDELEPDPAIASSGWVFASPPEEQPFAAALVDALRARPAEPLDLRSMTWESRARRVAALCAQVLESPRGSVPRGV